MTTLDRDNGTLEARGCNETQVPSFLSPTSSVQRSDGNPADLIETLAESNVVFRSSIISGRLASGSHLPTRKLSLMIARTSLLISDFDFDDILSKIESLFPIK